MTMSARKRTKEEEEDVWDLVDKTKEAKPEFTFEVTKDAARAAASMEGGRSHPGTMKLQSKEVMAALPSMTRQEKKDLQKALVKDEEKEAERLLELHRRTMAEYGYGGLPDMARLGPTADLGGNPLPRHLMAGYGHGEPDSLGIPTGYAHLHSSSSSTQGPIAQQPVPPGKSDGSEPKSVRDRKLATFRRDLYDRQVRGDRLTPSQAAPVPTERQALCKHPFDELRWSANQDGHYAKCRLCDLKSVIYWSSKHGVLMVNIHHTRPDHVPDDTKVWVREDKKTKHLSMVNEGGPTKEQVCWRITKDKNGKVLCEDDYTGNVVPFEKQLDKAQTIVTEFWYRDATTVEVYGMGQGAMPHLKVPGLAIADSGCRNSVGGIQWHNVMQEKLKEMGVPWLEVEEKETYKFGAGDPIVSKKACVYPVRIHGHWDLLRMSVVDQDASTCPGLVGPSELSRWQAVFRFGQKELELFGEKKPMVLTWTRHPGIQLIEYTQEEVQEALKYLESKEAQEKKKILIEHPQSLSFVAQHEEEETSEEDDEESQEEDELEDREKKKAQWMHHLQHDLGIQVQGDETVPEEELVTESGEESAEDSSTSHEVGIEIVTSGSEDDEEAEKEAEARGSDTFISYGQKRPMNKHLKKRLAAQANGISDSYGEEKEVEQKKKKIKKEKTPVAKEVTRAPNKAKWTVLEVFTWTCAISIMASARGWGFHEPVTLPRWDLLQEKDYNEALSYLDRVEPDLLVLAFPCGPWSPLQSFNSKTPYQRAQLAAKREEHRTPLRFVRDASIRQRERGGALLGENPKPSLAWREPLIEEAFEGMPSTTCDMCMFNLKIPGDQYLRKRTTLKGTPEILNRCSRMCDGRHQHAHVFGTCKIQGKWTNLSSFAGGYTASFSRAVIKGAEDFLVKKREKNEVFAEGDEVPEEQFMEDEQEFEEEEEGVEDEKDSAEDKTKKWKIAQLHRRLGHPTNNTLAKMLQLSGANVEMINMSKTYKCPTCQQVSAPGRYPKQTPVPRTTMFGREVHLDLKYMHDTANKLFVALSIVDAGTSFHMAVLLRNRNATHVASKFHRHWCSHYGVPTAVILDQGGEFDGAFVGWLEAHGIFSKYTGARAGWQHGFCERHGGLLGHAWHALVWQYQVKGKSEMKESLSAATQAKNQTVTRSGFTPYQAVFGRAPFFPDILDDEATGNLALRELNCTHQVSFPVHVWAIKPPTSQVCPCFGK